MTMELRFGPARVEGQTWCSVWRLTAPGGRLDASVLGCPQDLHRSEVHRAQGSGGALAHGIRRWG